jgi:hypothetical protein
MRVLDPFAVLAAAAVSGPAWWGALVRDDVPLGSAATTFLIALAVFAVAVAGVHRMVEGYAAGKGDSTPRRRTEDQADEDRLAKPRRGR